MSPAGAGKAHSVCAFLNALVLLFAIRIDLKFGYVIKRCREKNEAMEISE